MREQPMQHDRWRDGCRSLNSARSQRAEKRAQRDSTIAACIHDQRHSLVHAPLVPAQASALRAALLSSPLLSAPAMLSACAAARLPRPALLLLHSCRRSIHTHAALLSPASGASAAPAASPSSAAESASAAASAAAVQPISVISFPKTASYLEGKARDAARARAAAGPRPVRRQPVAHPRNMQLQPKAPRVEPLPVRSLVDGRISVPWRIRRDASGLLPLHTIKPVVHENSKQTLEITGLSGDVESFARELQLVVGPLYYVDINSVQSRVTVKSSPKSKVDEKCVGKIRQWIIKLGA